VGDRARDARAGRSVWFGAVVRADVDPIVIGPGSIVEDNAVVHGRVTTGRGAIVAHGAIVQDCSLGDRAVLGANSVAFNATIGEGAIVTIGSVVYPGTVIPPFTIFRNARAAITRTFNLSGIGSRSGTPAAIALSSRSTGRRRSTNAPSATAGVHAGLAALEGRGRLNRLGLIAPG